MTAEWTSWSGAVTCRPRRIVACATQDDVCREVARAGDDGLEVRVAGAGHSFSPLVATDGVLLRVDGLQGVESIDPGSMRAWVRAGTRLGDLGAPLRDAGMALHNMGDVDVQTLAGAVSTGTHGTGAALGSLSTAVVGMRVVDATGRLRTLDGSLLDAARVGLGACGVVTAVQLQCVPAYRLHERMWLESFDECMARLDERIAATRHFEYFWFPEPDQAACKSLHPVADDPGDLGEGERVDHSDRIFPSVRDVAFNEMEFAVPAELGPACFAQIRTLMRTHHPEVRWPVEYRTVAADDIPLSPAYGRPTVTLSIHQRAGKPHEAFFADAQSVFREFDGRPHWGKMHTLRADDLAPLYPRWQDFQLARQTLDPDGRLLNQHLRHVLSP